MTCPRSHSKDGTRPKRLRSSALSFRTHGLCSLCCCRGCCFLTIRVLSGPNTSFTFTQLLDLLSDSLRGLLTECPNTYSLLPSFGQMKPFRLGLQAHDGRWSVAAVWSGVAEHSEDLAQGPGLGCRAGVDSGECWARSWKWLQLFLKEERGPRSIAVVLLCWKRI